MTEYLGYVTWWTVGEPTITDGELREHVMELMPEVKPPAAILPQDAFRRMTGEAGVRRYTGSDDGIVRELSLQEVSAPKSMMSRAILLTLTKDGRRQSVDRVGDVVFYRPPRNEHHKARIRVTAVQGLAGSERQLFDLYANGVRAEYDRALHHLNGQAVRRIVRAYLAAIEAELLGGPYLVTSRADVERLHELLDRVGNASCRYVAVSDDDVNRHLLGKGD